MTEDEQFRQMQKMIEARAVDKNVESVVMKLRSRANVGLIKYGVTTERGDLTTLEWITHAQEEALDFAVYLERLKKDFIGVSEGSR